MLERTAPQSRRGGFAFRTMTADRMLSARRRADRGDRRRRIYRRPLDRAVARRAPRPASAPSISNHSMSGISGSTTSRICASICRRRTHASRRAPAQAQVFNLAADMGGMGFIETHKSRVHAVGADQHPHADGRAATPACSAIFFSSSACVYAADKQTSAAVTPLKEERRLSRNAGRRLRLGEAVRRAAVPPFPRGLSASRRALRATTTSTARTAPTTAAARRRRRRSAGR